MSDRLLRNAVMTGALGSVLLAIGAVGVGWLPPLFNTSVNPLLDLLRNGTGGQLASHSAVFLGGALMLQAWLLVGMEVLTDSRQLRPLQVLAAWAVPLLFTPPLFSRDVYSYIAQGRLMASGLDPYTHGVAWLPGWFQLGVDPAWAETPTPYGPVFVGLQWLVVNLTPGSPWWSMLGFRMISLGGVLLMATAVSRLARIHGIDPQAAFWLSVVNPLVLMHLVAGIHNDALMIGAMSWAFVFALNRKRLQALGLMLVAVGVKPIALLALPLVVLAWMPRTSSLRDRILQLAAALAALFGGLALLGKLLGIGVGWLPALTTPGSVRTLLSPATALGQVIGLVLGWFGLDVVDAAITLARLLFMAAAVLIVARLLLRPHGQSPLRLAGIAFTTVVLLSPVIQPWYLLWALPLVAASGLYKAWHLRTMVVGTAFFVMYALTESNVTTDSTIGWNDVWSTIAAIAVVALVLLASPGERALALGGQFAAGLAPRTDEDAELARQQRVLPDPA